jgi:DNA-binding response OmpR family regulator
MIFEKKTKVLLVDDDEIILRLHEKYLSGSKYKVIKAKSGKEGIEKAQKLLPDIIIMDIMMPELDGMATALKLKSIENTKSIPIIMCTAVKEDEDEIVARHLGVVDYLRKPVLKKALLTKLETVLSSFDNP